MNTASTVAAATGSTAAVEIKHPPGPKGLPVIGCLLPFLKNPMEALTDIARRYGGLARVPIRGKYLYVLSDPEMLKEMLIAHRAKYMKNIRYRHIQALLGQGLLLSEAAEWRRQRVITQPAFKPEAVDASVVWMGPHIDRFLDRWNARADREEVFDVEPDFNRLAQLLSGRYLLGEPFADIADEFCEVAAAVKKTWPQAPRNIVRAFIPHSKALIARFDAAIAALDACIFGFIQRNRATDFEGCGVLKRIVASSRAEGGQEFDDKSLRDQISTLFFAGHETSATGLCWIHWALSRHPAIRTQMREEVTAVLGDRLATAAEVHQLQYTGQVIDESLRLHSPIHSISRVALEDNTVGGYHVPKGVTVAISMYAIHRQAHLYPDPEKFDPSRFEPEKVALRHRFAYLPFAAGHRNCIGAGQALVELKLIVARIAQRFELDLAPGQRVEPAPGTTMFPRYGMKMRIRHAQRAQ
jgi:cytochrome P450